MRSQDKRIVKVGWAKVTLSLAVGVLLGFCLYPCTRSLYHRYLARATEGYCKSILANGQTFPAKSVDYTTQFNYCERNPSRSGACGLDEPSYLVDVCRQYR
jgi:hypothetical protein